MSNIQCFGACPWIDAVGAEKGFRVGDQALHGGAHHFSPLPKSGGGNALKRRRLSREEGLGARFELDNCGGDFRRRRKRLGADIEQSLRLATPLRDNR